MQNRDMIIVECGVVLHTYAGLVSISFYIFELQEKQSISIILMNIDKSK